MRSSAALKPRTSTVSGPPCDARASVYLASAAAAINERTEVDFMGRLHAVGNRGVGRLARHRPSPQEAGHRAPVPCRPARVARNVLRSWRLGRDPPRRAASTRSLRATRTVGAGTRQRLFQDTPLRTGAAAPEAPVTASPAMI